MADDANQDSNPYRAPAAVEESADEYVFSPTRRRRMVVILGWIAVVNFIVFPIVCNITAAEISELQRWPWVLGISLFVIIVVIHRLSVWTVNLLSFQGMRDKLRSRLHEQGVPVDQLGGQFVQFSPAAEPRVYDSFTNWDVGFLFLFSDHLVYLGERARFSLHRRQITRLWRDYSGSEPTSESCTYLSWSSDDKARSGCVNFERGDRIPLVGSLAVPKLHRRLVEWKEGSLHAAEVRVMPDGFRQLVLPDIQESPGMSYKHAQLLRQMIAGVLCWILLVMVSCVVSGIVAQLENKTLLINTAMAAASAIVAYFPHIRIITIISRRKSDGQITNGKQANREAISSRHE